MNEIEFNFDNLTYHDIIEVSIIEVSIIEVSIIEVGILRIVQDVIFIYILNYLLELPIELICLDRLFEKKIKYMS